MTPTESAIGPILVPPPAVRPAAWPRERSLLVWMAANCDRCDEAPGCEARWEASQDCRKVAAAAPKKRA
ncbi:MAG: hypothetical protein JSR61_10255 [Proteobacteria bacterium]|nr:hypothetical protein [Pseudomonadota bacterium]